MACSSEPIAPVQSPRRADTSESTWWAAALSGCSSTARRAHASASAKRALASDPRIAFERTVQASAFVGSSSVAFRQATSDSPYLPSLFNRTPVIARIPANGWRNLGWVGRPDIVRSLLEGGDCIIDAFQVAEGETSANQRTGGGMAHRCGVVRVQVFRSPFGDNNGIFISTEVEEDAGSRCKRLDCCVAQIDRIVGTGTICA